MEVRGISQGGQISLDNLTKIDNNNGENQVGTSVDATSTQDINGHNQDNNSTNSQTVSEKEVNKALNKLSGFINNENTRVEYSYHNYFTQDLMIKIVDKDTNNVLLEIPPKKILDLVAKMMEMVGVLFDKKA